jgi:sugar fermentation stimulation protein A
MKLPPNLVSATLERRYKRFLADVVLADGDRVTVHCPNTGAMLGCDEPGSRVWLSVSDNPRRKYAHTWELVEVPGETMVGINSGRANRIVGEALETGLIRELTGYAVVRSEVPYGEKSRVDFLLQDDDRPDCFLEVKSVTLADGQGTGMFPDACSSRGTRHLKELMTMRASGARAINLFCVQRADVDRVVPADDIDPEYGRILRQAAEAGVELLAWVCALSPEEIRLERSVPVVLA